MPDPPSRFSLEYETLRPVEVTLRRGMGEEGE
jgi:hypothetical protein